MFCDTEMPMINIKFNLMYITNYILTYYASFPIMLLFELGHFIIVHEN